MYKAIYKVQDQNIDSANNRLFTPFVNCYIIHSAILYVNGVAGEQDVDFVFNGNYTETKLGYDLSDDDSFILDINYFYIKENTNMFDFLIQNSFSNKVKSNEIVSKHYINGQFSLDNGLYKNAVMNFGTVLEGLLNEGLSKATLATLIKNYSVTSSKKGSADKADMDFIRNLRNKVHANTISATQDVSRQEAIEARNKLELILNKL
ncbi:hypothetical protein [Arsenicibacter rosenii]|uniref:Uncharacterized protein n=1 Tax=Arsenicibacter rosenii TaxID=1750698 RepID=A0A1S2VP58_9BACT|nr:hypothetical protein [Arsenicibacter rosenii]OIN59966.1 hypothetical protein BLX24_09015 [Arsenicibacter rosenii]